MLDVLVDLEELADCSAAVNIDTVFKQIETLDGRALLETLADQE